MDKDLEDLEEEMLADIKKEEKRHAEKWNKFKRAAPIIFGVVGVIVILVGFVFMVRAIEADTKERNLKQEIEERQYHETLFKVWAKQYGNPNDLTIEEFIVSRIDKSEYYRRHWKVLPPAKYRGKEK